MGGFSLFEEWMVVKWQEGRGSRRPGGPASTGNTASIDGLEQPVTVVPEEPGASVHHRQPYSHTYSTLYTIHTYSTPPHTHTTKNQ